MLRCFILFLLTIPCLTTLAFVSKPLQCQVKRKRYGRDQVHSVNWWNSQLTVQHQHDPSLNDILSELDAKGIRYPPTASKSDLMNLLLSSENSAISSTQQQLQHESDTATVESEKNQALAGSSKISNAVDEKTLESNQQLQEIMSNQQSPKEQDADSIIAASVQESSVDDNQRETTLASYPSSLLDLGESVPLESAAYSSIHPPVESKSSQVSGKGLSLSDLLQRLDALNIRYSPTASRQSLEHLLSEHLKNQEMMHEETTVHSNESSRSSGNGSSINTNQNSKSGSNQLSIISLLKLLDRLDELGVRYPPAASRQELEQLLEAHQAALKSNEARTQSSGIPKSKEFVSSQIRPESSLSKLLEELDELGVRYSPTAKRVELEAMLERARRRNEKTNSQSDQIRNDGQETVSNVSRRQRRRVETTISDLMEELDERGIPIPSGATRLELEALLQEELDTTNKDQVLSDASTRQSRRRRRMQKQESELSPIIKLLQKGQQTILESGVWETLPNAVGSKAVLTVDRAKRKARQVSRRATDFFVVDDDGVRDVSYRYVRRDPVTNPQSSNDSNVNKSKEMSGTSLDGLEETSTDAAADRRKRQASYSQRQSQSVHGRSPRDSSTNNQKPRGSDFTPRRRKRLDDDEIPSDRVFIQKPSPQTSNLKRLPPVGGVKATDFTSRGTPASRKPTSREPSSPSRRIYSPYKDSFYSDRDAIDKFGKFVKDSADNIMWGDESSSQTGGPRHWKDKLEERFDSLLGIHEDGKEYRRWTEKMKADKREEGGFDALSVAQGREPKQYGTSRPRRSKAHKKPFWEEEGNIASLLFGRTQSGQSLLFEKLLDQETGSLLNLFRAAFKSVLLVASYLCRWASVRGALPQPLVALGVITAGLSARPRHRIRAVVIALIVMRTCGELIHGYVYGDEGWEEDVDGEDDPIDENEVKLLDKRPDPL